MASANNLELDERLARLAKDTGRSKSYYVRRAIEDWLEDYEDYLIALQRLETDKGRIPLERLEKQLGLED